VKITLFIPGKQPMRVCSPQFAAAVTGGTIVPKLHRIAQLLKCRPSLVDVLACGHGYGIYSVFDAEGKSNALAMAEFTRLTGVQLDPEEDHDQLLGPVVTLTLC
jgi:hypothetical protein